MIPLNGSEFSVPTLPTNQFVSIGTERGRTQILYLGESTKSELCIDTQNIIKWSSECVQYIVTSVSGRHIGSLFVVNAKKVNFNHSFFYVREYNEFATMQPVQTEGVGSVFVFRDEHMNVLIMPSSPVVTNLIVVE